VFASTSGHTEYVVDALIKSLKGIAPGWEIEETMAEKTQPQDLLRGDILLLAAATWNTGGTEGQLNPHMWVLLLDKAKNLDLALKPCACVGLGDHRYFYTARRSRRRTSDLVTQPASQGLSENENGCVRISMMAKSMNALFTGRIQKRKTNPLHHSHLACNTRPVHTVGS
jgi:flavodoxin